MKLAFTRPSDFVDDGLKPVFRVTTRLGRSVEATLPHPFLTVRGCTKLAELKVGDHIAVPRKLAGFGHETARECEVKLLAYLIGDGCLTHTCPSFTNSNALIREDFSQAVADFGGLTVRLADCKGTRTPYLRVVANPDFIATHRRQFGLNLRAAIAALGKSSRQVALAIPASPVSLHEWQKGACVPGRQKFAGLCEILNLKASDLSPYEIEVISANSKNSITRWLDKLGLMGKGAAASLFRRSSSSCSGHRSRCF